MSGFAEALIYIVQTLKPAPADRPVALHPATGTRRLLQPAQRQFTVKATQPLLKLLRRIIPGFGGLDLASLALAILVQLVLMVLVILIAGANPRSPAAAGVGDHRGDLAVPEDLLLRHAAAHRRQRDPPGSRPAATTLARSWSTRSANRCWRPSAACCRTLAAWISRRSSPSSR